LAGLRSGARFVAAEVFFGPTDLFPFSFVEVDSTAKAHGGSKKVRHAKTQVVRKNRRIRSV
jgi:hypothetical protein